MIPQILPSPSLPRLGTVLGGTPDDPQGGTGAGNDMAVLGLAENVFGSPMAVILILIGLLALVMSLTMLVRAIPHRAGGVAHVEEGPEEGPEATPRQAPAVQAKTARPAPSTPRPRTTSDKVRIRFPDIDDAHPDVWDTEAPLTVVVTVRDGDAGRADAQVRLVRTVKGRTAPVGEAATDERGVARFEVTFPETGEQDLVATRILDDRPAGQAVRAVRVVEYRDEVVETFEDFRSWAASNFSAVDPRHTAREFIDRFADSRPGTPTAPLETIVGIYEVANYSEHPVDRATYLRMVDAFLELEDAGALDAEETVPA